MMGRTHQVIGLAATTGLYLLISPDTPILSTDFAAALALTALASVLPDIDANDNNLGDPAARRMLGIGNNQSKQNISRAATRLRRTKKAGPFITNLLNLLATLLWGLLVFLINIPMQLIGHRGLTHWALTWLLLTCLVLLIAALSAPHLPLQAPYLIAFSFSLGYGSHLAADMMTKSGLPILAPYCRKRYRLLPKRLALTTGSFIENIIFVLLVLLLVVMLTHYHTVTTAAALTTLTLAPYAAGTG
jgi:membrane-bound metal-dependent hydrolase YbcI (DUF457 family)